MFSCISLHKNPTPRCGSIPGNPKGRSGGSAPLHVTAATNPCRARKPIGAAPPLPGTLEEDWDTPLPLPRPQGPGMLSASQRGMQGPNSKERD